MANKMNFIKNPISRGEYEYEIDIPQMHKVGKIGESVGSNPGSVVGNYSDIKESANQGMVSSNISVKKSMLKIAAQTSNPGSGAPGTSTDIRDRDMDMSPKSSKNDGQFNYMHKY